MQHTGSAGRGHPGGHGGGGEGCWGVGVGWGGAGRGEEGGGKLPPFQVAPLPVINCASCESHSGGSSQRTSQQNLIKPEPFSTSIIRNTQFTQVIRPPNYKPMFLHARLPPLIAPSLGSANGPWLLSYRPWGLRTGNVSARACPCLPEAVGSAGRRSRAPLGALPQAGDASWTWQVGGVQGRSLPGQTHKGLFSPVGQGLPVVPLCPQQQPRPPLGNLPWPPRWTKPP